MSNFSDFRFSRGISSRKHLEKRDTVSVGTIARVGRGGKTEHGLKIVISSDIVHKLGWDRKNTAVVCELGEHHEIKGKLAARLVKAESYDSQKIKLQKSGKQLFLGVGRSALEQYGDGISNSIPQSSQPLKSSIRYEIEEINGKKSLCVEFEF